MCADENRKEFVENTKWTGGMAKPNISEEPDTQHKHKVGSPKEG